VAQDGKGTEGGGDYEFKLPNFDEDAFIHREMVSFKTTAILFVWGIVAALVSWAAFAIIKGETPKGWYVGAALCFGFGALLKTLFRRFGADVSHFKRGNWVGTYLLFFFTWLAFFMVAINPPVSDFSPPQVVMAASPPLQSAGGAVGVTILAVDNAGTPTVDLHLMRGQTEFTDYVRVVDGDREQVLLANATAGTYTLLATATDARGHSTTSNTTFVVGGGLEVLPRSGTLAEGTTLLVNVPGGIPCDSTSYQTGKPCVRRVFLKGSDGQEMLNLEFSSADGNRWRATSSFQGWKTGNNTFTVVAEFLDHYLGAERVAGGQTVAGPFTLNVPVAGGAYQAQNILPQPQGRTLLGPAWGLIGTAGILLGAAVVARQRRHRNA
jgi:hypothetical protein